MNSRINLFQYWDSGAPPPEVQRLIETWPSDGDFVHRFYDERSAEDYIAQHAGQQALEAFRLCAFGAMQADLFRYVALTAEGGIWMDADQGNKGGLAQFVQAAPEGMLITGSLGELANHFIFARKPGSPLMAHVLQTAIENIEGRISNNVSKVTGPMVLEAVLNGETTHPLFSGWLIEARRTAKRYIHFAGDLPHKKTEYDWRPSAYGAPRSIFRNEPFVYRAGDIPAAPRAERPSDGGTTRPSSQAEAAALGRELAECKAELAAMGTLQRQKDDEIQKLRRRTSQELRELRERQSQELRDLRERKDARLRVLQQRNEKQGKRLAEAERVLKEIQRSTAWRITGPLRRVMGGLRRSKASSKHAS